MFEPLIKGVVTGVLLYTLCLPSLVFAEPKPETIETSWGMWFSKQIDLHPEVVAAKESMNAAFSIADGRERPLYNPELETEFEREGEENNYRVGFSQTVDWWDKRGARTQQAGFSRAAARQDFALTVQEKTAEALQALIEWQAAKQEAELARSQEAQLDTLLALVKERQSAGDLGQVDAELAFLSLSQKLNETARAQAQFRQVEAHLRELLPDWSSLNSSKEGSQIPEKFWSVDSFLTNKPGRAEELVDKHPAVVAARAEWEALQQSAELARREIRPDPTFALSGGKSGDDNAVALSFSLPLHVRNNFSAEARAASKKALAAEAHYRAIRRKQQYAMQATQSISLEYQQRFERWQSLMRGSGDRVGNLLKKRWQSGDLSTTEYLLALQQRTEGLLAGIELRAHFRLTSIDWLLQTGQVTNALSELK